VASRLLALSALFLVACGGLPDASHDAVADQSQLSVLDGSPEAVGVLALLNASTTDLDVLDDDVPLNKRAAQHLIAWRDGADGVRYTSDDRAFQTMQQVDDVRFVGPAALASLVAYAEATGLVPTGGDLLGVWDNTAFTVDEADATIALANLGSYDLLDDEVPLSSRAVDNIVAARTFVTIAQLAAVPQVGPSSMLKLREFARTWSPQAPLAQLGEDCDEVDDCDAGLICLGAISWNNGGWCVEDSFADTFVVNQGGLIPDGDPNGFVSTVDVQGLASVPIDIQVWLDLDHPDPASLSYRLIDPNGADAILAAPDANGIAAITWRNITSDDEIHGIWTLEIIDPVTGDAGQLDGWSLYLTSTYD